MTNRIVWICVCIWVLNAMEDPDNIKESLLGKYYIDPNLMKPTTSLNDSINIIKTDNNDGDLTHEIDEQGNIVPVKKIQKHEDDLNNEDDLSEIHPDITNNHEDDMNNEDDLSEFHPTNNTDREESSLIDYSKETYFCAICTEHVPIGEIERFPNCRHGACKECLSQSSLFRCQYCRRSLSSNQGMQDIMNDNVMQMNNHMQHILDHIPIYTNPPLQPNQNIQRNERHERYCICATRGLICGGIIGASVGAGGGTLIYPCCATITHGGSAGCYAFVLGYAGAIWGAIGGWCGGNYLSERYGY